MSNHLGGLCTHIVGYTSGHGDVKDDAPFGTHVWQGLIGLKELYWDRFGFGRGKANFLYAKATHAAWIGVFTVPHIFSKAAAQQPLSGKPIGQQYPASFYFPSDKHQPIMAKFKGGAALLEASAVVDLEYPDALRMTPALYNPAAECAWEYGEYNIMMLEAEDDNRRPPDDQYNDQMIRGQKEEALNLHGGKESQSTRSAQLMQFYIEAGLPIPPNAHIVQVSAAPEGPDGDIMMV